MEGQQKRTFLPYLRGVPPEDLRLGSLYINPLEPNDGLDSLRWEFMDEEPQAEYEKAVSKWTRERPEIDEPFAIEFEASKARSLGFSFTDFLNLSGEKTKDSLVSIHGQSGRRIKIRKPEAFLKEVMKQPGVQQWICEHASIAHKSNYGLNRWRAPRIWMVTGVQHVTGGDIQSKESASTKAGGAAGGDPSIAAGAPPGTLKTRIDGTYEKSNRAIADFGHADERIWAAQFMPVNIKFGPEEDTDLSSKNKGILPKTIASFRLKDVPDLEMKGIRDKENQEPLGPVPKLIARVTVQPPQDDAVEDDDDDDDDTNDGFVIDDELYMNNNKETNWEQYAKYKKWLRGAYGEGKQEESTS